MLWHGVLFYGILGIIHFQDKIALPFDLSYIPLDLMEQMTEKACNEFIKLHEKFKKPILCVRFSGLEDNAVARNQDGVNPVYPKSESSL